MKQRSKFNVGKDEISRTYDGITFDSELEKRYYSDVLVPFIESGVIADCERQKKYILQPSFKRDGKTVPAIEYKADFYVRFATGSEQVVDVKGYAEPLAKLKRKMFWRVFPDIKYIWIGFSKLDGGWVPYEEIQAGRKQRKKSNKKGSLR